MINDKYLNFLKLNFQREKIKHVREAVPVTEVGSQCRLTFKMPGISAKDLDATVLAPSGKVTQLSDTLV